MSCTLEWKWDGEYLSLINRALPLTRRDKSQLIQLPFTLSSKVAKGGNTLLYFKVRSILSTV